MQGFTFCLEPGKYEPSGWMVPQTYREVCSECGNSCDEKDKLTISTGVIKQRIPDYSNKAYLKDVYLKFSNIAYRNAPNYIDWLDACDTPPSAPLPFYICRKCFEQAKRSFLDEHAIKYFLISTIVDIGSMPANMRGVISSFFVTLLISDVRTLKNV